MITSHSERRQPWMLILLINAYALHLLYKFKFAPQLEAQTYHAATDNHAARSQRRQQPHCTPLPTLFNKVATEEAATYTNTSRIQLAIPHTGLERNVIANILTILRYNLSVPTLTFEHAWPQGCISQHNEQLSRLERLTLFITHTHSSPPQIDHKTHFQARYLPDTLQMEFTGVRFTVTVQYDVQQLGIHTGSGIATLTGTGSVWLDDISLRLEDIAQDQGRSMGCGGDISIEQLEFHGDYHHTEGLFTGEGIQRPDIIGYVCDGYETRNNNPFATGWEWVGPGEQEPGLRNRVARYIQSKCTHPTLIERACGMCIMPYTWPAAALDATKEAFSNDPIDTSLFTLTAIYIILYCIKPTR